ncbi:MAG: hypothetical protein H8D22_10650 [Candidatus Cloacimonetes bacterium]|nr:hypothetical protein [Candidatus Cloacimonadota bacterium]
MFKKLILIIGGLLLLFVVMSCDSSTESDNVPVKVANYTFDSISVYLSTDSDTIDYGEIASYTLTESKNIRKNVNYYVNAKRTNEQDYEMIGNVNALCRGTITIYRRDDGILKCDFI